MKTVLLVAACLTVLVAAAHSYLGERYILTRLFRRENLPKLFGGTEFTRRTLRFAWHLTSVAWLGFGVLLVQVGSYRQAEQSRVGAALSMVFVASALLTLVGSKGRHLAWPVFLAIGALAWWGSR